MNALWILAFIIVPAAAIAATWGVVLLSEKRSRRHDHMDSGRGV